MGKAGLEKRLLKTLFGEKLIGEFSLKKTLISILSRAGLWNTLKKVLSFCRLLLCLLYI